MAYIDILSAAHAPPRSVQNRPFGSSLSQQPTDCSPCGGVRNVPCGSRDA